MVASKKVSSIRPVGSHRFLGIDSLLQLLRPFHKLDDRLARSSRRLDGYASVAKDPPQNSLLHHDVIDLVEWVFLGSMGDHTPLVN